LQPRLHRLSRPNRARAIFPPWARNLARASYWASVRAAAEQAAETRKRADRLTKAWNKRMLAFKGPAQPSPTPGDALNAGATSQSAVSAATNQTVRDWLV
jgi:hypothetical protein